MAVIFSTKPKSFIKGLLKSVVLSITILGIIPVIYLNSGEMKVSTFVLLLIGFTFSPIIQRVLFGKDNVYYIKREGTSITIKWTQFGKEKRKNIPLDEIEIEKKGFLKNSYIMRIEIKEGAEKTTIKQPENSEWSSELMDKVITALVKTAPNTK